MKGDSDACTKAISMMTKILEYATISEPLIIALMFDKAPAESCQLLSQIISRLRGKVLIMLSVTTLDRNNPSPPSGKIRYWQDEDAVRHPNWHVTSTLQQLGAVSLDSDFNSETNSRQKGEELKGGLVIAENKGRTKDKADNLQVTYRPVEVIHMSLMTYNSTVELVRKLFGSQDVCKSVEDFIVLRGGGSPFFTRSG